MRKLDDNKTLPGKRNLSAHGLDHARSPFKKFASSRLTLDPMPDEFALPFLRATQDPYLIAYLTVSEELSELETDSSPDVSELTDSLSEANSELGSSTTGEVTACVTLDVARVMLEAADRPS